MKIFSKDLQYEEKKKTYILDNIKCILDGIDNTGSGHSSSTTTWKDLSGNSNDFTLSNVTWESKRAYFDGSSSTGRLNINLGTNQTLEIVCIVTDTIGGSPEKPLLANFSTLAVGEYGIQNASYTSGIGYTIFNGGWRDMNILPTASYEQNKIYTFSVTYDGATMKGYVDGVFANSLSTTGTIGSRDKNLKIMGSNNSGVYTKGYVYAIRIYNRALTADEIAHNRSVDVSKYNI